MPGLFFINTLMLAGLAALGIPVLIHLLLKRRKKKVPFSTIRFFKLQDEQSSRRRKLRNWLLLALRLLIISLLVMAFSRPYSQRSGGLAANRKQHRVVFVLDRSASMLATGTEGKRWDLAKARIQKTIAGLEPEDLVALVECTAHANVLSGFGPPANAAQLIRDLPPALGTSSLAEGVQQAVRLFSGSPQNASSSIYLVTDLQKSACHGLASCPVPQSVEFNLLAVGDLSSPNLSVVALEPARREGGRPTVAVGSFSDEDAKGTVDLSADGHGFASIPLVLKAGASTNIDFALPGLKAGWHDVKATVRVKDSLEEDNSRFASFLVPEPAKVLLVEPKSTAKVFDQATFFVSSALNPTMDSTNAAAGPFNLTVVSPENLEAQLSRSTKDNSFNVIIMPGLKDLPVGIGKALGSFVRAGGGLILFLDQGMSANRYNSELTELLPARVGDPDRSPEVGSPWRIALLDTNSAVFAAFRSANSGDLRIPEFTGRRLLEVPEGASRLAFFDDGIPLVLTRDAGLGRVLLINTSADSSSTDWPKHKTFVPFLHGVTRFAAQRTSRYTADQSNQFTTGEDFDFGTGAKESGPLALKLPDQKVMKLVRDAHGKMPNIELDVPGIYSLADKDGHEIRRFAVNLPAQESNLEALRGNDFLQQLVRVQESPKETLAAGLFGARNDRHEFWTALLLGALILLLVEPFVANRTSI
jgi:hypothetical protein